MKIYGIDIDRIRCGFHIKNLDRDVWIRYRDPYNDKTLDIYFCHYERGGRGVDDMPKYIKKYLNQEEINTLLKYIWEDTDEPYRYPNHTTLPYQILENFYNRIFADYSQHNLFVGVDNLLNIDAVKRYIKSDSEMNYSETKNKYNINNKSILL